MAEPGSEEWQGAGEGGDFHQGGAGFDLDPTTGEVWRGGEGQENFEEQDFANMDEVERVRYLITCLLPSLTLSPCFFL